MNKKGLIFCLIFSNSFIYTIAGDVRDKLLEIKQIAQKEILVELKTNKYVQGCYEGNLENLNFVILPFCYLNINSNCALDTLNEFSEMSIDSSYFCLIFKEKELIGFAQNLYYPRFIGMQFLRCDSFSNGIKSTIEFVEQISHSSEEIFFFYPETRLKEAKKYIGVVRDNELIFFDNKKYQFKSLKELIYSNYSSWRNYIDIRKVDHKNPSQKRKNIFVRFLNLKN